MRKSRELTTLQRIEQYEGKLALLKSWEEQPPDVLIENRAYLRELAQQVRQVRNYILHRADVDAVL